MLFRFVKKVNLQVKITVLILFILILVNTLISLYIYNVNKQNASEIAGHYIGDITSIIDTSINTMMLTGNADIISKLVDILSRREGVLGIHIFSSNELMDSKLNYSRSQKPEFYDEYLRAIKNNLKKEENVVDIKTEHLEFRSYYKPYKNKISCAKCHDENNKIIGILNINTDASRIENLLMKKTVFVFYFLIFLSVFLGALISYLLKYLITNPIKKLEKNMKEVSKGNLEMNLAISSGDELGRLAKYYRDMIGALNKANKSIDLMHRNMLHADRLMSVGTLTAAINHEIKNPLNSIVINTDVLMTKIKDEDLTIYLERIINDGNKINYIIDHTLNFSRYLPEGDKTIRVSDFVKDIKSFAKRILFDKKGIVFRVIDKRIDHDTVIDFNRIFLEQIFINLLKNAYEAILPKSRGTITMEIDNDPCFVIFYVKDNGVGISKDKIKYVFEEFYTTKQGGTGLGLSIIKETLGNYNSTIDVVSEEGKGTLFTIKIPLCYANKNNSERDNIGVEE